MQITWCEIGAASLMSQHGQMGQMCPHTIAHTSDSCAAPAAFTGHTASAATFTATTAMPTVSLLTSTLEQYEFASSSAPQVVDEGISLEEAQDADSCTQELWDVLQTITGNYRTPPTTQHVGQPYLL